MPIVARISFFGRITPVSRRSTPFFFPQLKYHAKNVIMITTAFKAAHPAMQNVFFCFQIGSIRLYIELVMIVQMITIERTTFTAVVPSDHARSARPAV